MSRRPVSDEQPRFDGGLNSSSDDPAMLPNQFRESLNIRLSSYGAAVRRGGSWLTPSASVGGSGGYTGGGVFSRSDGSPLFAMVRGTSVIYADSIVGPWAVATGDPVSGGARAYFVSFWDGSERVVYIADGAQLLKLDETNDVSVVASAPAVKHIAAHNLRLWAVGDPTRPQSLIYSGLNAGDTLGDTLNGGGEIIVRTFGDDVLVAVASAGSSLLVFHENGVSRLTGYGQDDILVSPEGIARDLGLVSPDSIVPVDGGVFCVTNRGAYFVSESGVVQLGTVDKPDPIHAVISAEGYTGTIIGTLRRKTEEVLWSIPNVGTFAYHMTLRSWSGPWKGCFGGDGRDLQALASGNAEDPGNPYTEVVLGAYDDGRVAQLDEDSATLDYDDVEDPGTTGIPIPWSVRLRRMFFGDDAVAKAFRWFYLTANMGPSSDIVVSYLSDLSGGTGAIVVPSGGYWDDPDVSWDDPGATWTAGGSRSYRVSIGGTGYYLDVTVSSAGGTTPVVLSRAKVDAYILGRR